MYEDLKYYFDFIRKEIYTRYDVDQVVFTGGNLLFLNKYIMFKLNVGVPKSISYSINFNDFKKFYNLLPNAKNVDFYLKSIIINNEEIIIPNSVDEFHQALDIGIDYITNCKRFYYDFTYYEYLLGLYKTLNDIKNLKYIVLTDRHIHFINYDGRGVQIPSNNHKRHKGFPIAFDSISLSRFLKLAKHLNTNTYINFDERMMCFDNGNDKGLLIGSNELKNF